MAVKVSTLGDGRRAIIIRTSDRITFKQCRRKWGWTSHLKGYLTPYNNPAPLWFGSAFHYALEDYHGYNRFGRPERAFTAFCYATALNHRRELPEDPNNLLQLGISMLKYYVDHWCRFKPVDDTYWEDGVPQVEVNFEIPLPFVRGDGSIVGEYMDQLEADVILYRGTIDRIAIDENGSLWIVEYKTAKRAENMHFMTDPQIGAYMWAASQIYAKPVAGVIYMQYVKNAPEMPRILSSGKISTASNLVTSYPLYYQRLKDMYGDVRNAPYENIQYLGKLAAQETPDKDRYIQREKVHRNAFSAQAELVKICLEIEDMINPDLPLYPNPTRQCSYMCSFVTPCVSMDDGSDWEADINGMYAPREVVDDYWRKRLPSEDLLGYIEKNNFPDLEAINLGVIKLPHVATLSSSPEAFDDVGRFTDATSGWPMDTLKFQQATNPSQPPLDVSRGFNMDEVE